MKFEIKTEPVCVVFIAVPAYFAIVVITLGTGVQAHPLTVVVTILSIAGNKPGLIKEQLRKDRKE